jgi:hypothetical protein
VRLDGSVPDVAYIDPGEEFSLPPLTAQGVYDVTYFAVDLLGNTERPRTLHVRIDKTEPTVTIAEPAAGARYLLNESVAADYGCDDQGGSGLSLCSGTTPIGAVIDMSTVGPHTFTVTAADGADNGASVGHGYNVDYAFTGFSSPLDAPPTVNVANAGRTIPVKWRVVDAGGVGIADPSSFVSVTSALIGCDGGLDADAVETYADGPGLQYLGDGYWQFNWKTPKTFAGQCRVLILNLADTGGAARATLESLGRVAEMRFT